MEREQYKIDERWGHLIGEKKKKIARDKTHYEAKSPLGGFEMNHRIVWVGRHH